MKLRECPFCGSDKVGFCPDEEQYLESTITGFIWCNGCGFTSDSFYSEKVAAKKWNRRAYLLNHEELEADHPTEKGGAE